MNGNGQYESVYDESIFDIGEDTYAFGEDVGDYEALDDESYQSRRVAQARALARARAQARQRQRIQARAVLQGRRPGGNLPGRRPPLSRPSAPMNPSSGAQAIQRVGAELNEQREAIQDAKLNNMVQADAFARAMKRHSDRIGGAEYAQAASKVIDQIKEQWPDLVSDPILKAALPLAPLLLLRPDKRGNGVESILRDPRWLTGIAAGALLVWARVQKSQPEHLKLSVPEKVKASSTIKLVARVSNGQGVPVDRKVEWTSGDREIADFKDGQLVTTAKTGPVSITASSGGLQETAWITVE